MLVGVLEVLAHDSSAYTGSSLSYQLGGAVIVYVGLLVPTLFGALVHTAALFLVPRALGLKEGRILSFALATLLPAAPIFSNVPGGTFLAAFPYSTIAATIIYAFACNNVPRRHTATRAVTTKG